MFELPEGPVPVTPPLLLHDYSFRPTHVGWARETAAVSSDAWVLHPEAFPARDPWCIARRANPADQLASSPADLPKVPGNHYPLEERHAVLPRIPRFTPWYGTPKDPQLAPPVQRVRRRLRPSPHPGFH